MLEDFDRAKQEPLDNGIETIRQAVTLVTEGNLAELLQIGDKLHSACRFPSLWTQLYDVGVLVLDYGLSTQNDMATELGIRVLWDSFCNMRQYRQFDCLHLKYYDNMIDHANRLARERSAHSHEFISRMHNQTILGSYPAPDQRLLDATKLAVTTPLQQGDTVQTNRVDSVLHILKIYAAHYQESDPTEYAAAKESYRFTLHGVASVRPGLVFSELAQNVRKMLSFDQSLEIFQNAIRHTTVVQDQSAPGTVSFLNPDGTRMSCAPTMLENFFLRSLHCQGNHEKQQELLGLSTAMRTRTSKVKSDTGPTNAP